MRIKLCMEVIELHFLQSDFQPRIKMSAGPILEAAVQGCYRPAKELIFPVGRSVHALFYFAACLNKATNIELNKKDNVQQRWYLGDKHH